MNDKKAKTATTANNDGVKKAKQVKMFDLDSRDIQLDGKMTQNMASDQVPFTSQDRTKSSDRELQHQMVVMRNESETYPEGHNGA